MTKPRAKAATVGFFVPGNLLFFASYEAKMAVFNRQNKNHGGEYQMRCRIWYSPPFYVFFIPLQTDSSVLPACGRRFRGARTPVA